MSATETTSHESLSPDAAGALAALLSDAAPGRAQRSGAFADAVHIAAAFEAGRIEPWKLLRSLVIAAQELELSDGEFRHLVTLMALVPIRGWLSGEPFTDASQGLLARLQGCTRETVRRRTRGLERAELLIAHYDEANHPARERGVDLRPLAAWGGALSDVAGQVLAEHRRQRAARRRSFTAECSGAQATPELPSHPPQMWGSPHADEGGQYIHTSLPLSSYQTSTSARQDDVVPLAREAGHRLGAAGTRSGTTRSFGATARGALGATGGNGAGSFDPPSETRREAYAKSLRTGRWYRPQQHTPPPADAPATAEALCMLYPRLADLLGGREDWSTLTWAIEALAHELGLRQGVLRQALADHGLPVVAAAVVLAAARPRETFTSGPVGWLTALLRRAPEEIDVWASVWKALKVRAH